MKTITSRALRNSFPVVLRSLKAGESAAITLRGKTVAEIRKAPKAGALRELLNAVDAAWSPADRKRLGRLNAARLLEETR